MKILSYRTVIQKDGKRYHGFVPVLPGCDTDGKTIEETRKNLREAIKLWIETSKSKFLSIKNSLYFTSSPQPQLQLGVQGA